MFIEKNVESTSLDKIKKKNEKISDDFVRTEKKGKFRSKGDTTIWSRN